MPWIPWRSTSSATRNASERLTLPTVSSRRSLGMMISVSTESFRFMIPLTALFMRTFPSKAKGFVTTPMVRMPISFAHSATIGAAPVPVPPPMPAVIKTRSAPLSASVIVSRLSSAALRPTSGSAPAPNPLVSFSPIWIFCPARERYSACLSVFTEMNSTPRRPYWIMRLTALFPAPPTPTTFSCANWPLSKSSSKPMGM